ncbi:hypothetical protein [Nonomuraea solani]|nr:hypothetical protein [Nonomuraea solani]
MEISRGALQADDLVERTVVEHDERVFLGLCVAASNMDGCGD